MNPSPLPSKPDSDGWAHTPGPWAVHPRRAVIVPADHIHRPIGGASDLAYDLAHYAQEIAQMRMPDEHRPESETMANAHLIAAAPDLVSAVKAYLDAYDAVTGVIHVEGIMRVALAKARGQ